MICTKSFLSTFLLKNQYRIVWILPFFFPFFPRIFRGKVTRMYFFILHLSIADLLTAIGTLLPEFIWTFTSFPDFHGGNVGCKIIKYLFMVGPYLSSYTLVMTAVDRYQVTKVLQRLWTIMHHRRGLLFSLNDIYNFFSCFDSPFRNLLVFLSF